MRLSCVRHYIASSIAVLTVEFLKSADEVIISSTSAEVMPITKIDGENVQDGQVGTITRQLQQGFEKYIQSHSI